MIGPGPRITFLLFLHLAHSSFSGISFACVGSLSSSSLSPTAHATLAAENEGKDDEGNSHPDNDSKILVLIESRGNAKRLVKK